MIDFSDQPLFDNSAKVLVNPVNCVGVSGKGLARLFAERFPQGQRFYKMICEQEILKPGGFVCDMISLGLNGKWIGYFATKDHWQDPSRLGWIESGVAGLRAFIEEYRPPSVAVPALGCGNGGLSWTDVRRILEANLRGLDCQVTLHTPTAGATSAK